MIDGVGYARTQSASSEVNMERPFVTRRQAGEKLAIKLAAYAERPDVLVLALPRGGVPRGIRSCACAPCAYGRFPRAQTWCARIRRTSDGAIASGGVRVVNKEITTKLDIPENVIDAIARREEEELQRRELLYRGDRPGPNVQGGTVILVDDGLATGSTMRAAALALRQMQPNKLIVAVPVGAQETCDEFRDEVDEIVCAMMPEPFMAVGAWYSDFSQTSDDEVRELLQMAAADARDGSLALSS